MNPVRLPGHAAQDGGAVPLAGRALDGGIAFDTAAAGATCRDP